MTTHTISSRTASASAADPSTPLRITFNRLTCIRETSELGADDPYLVFVVSNLSVFPYPTVVSLSDTFTMGEGETRRQGQGEDGNRRHLGPLWPLGDNGAAPIRASDDLLMLVALVESDGGPGLALSVQNAVQASLAINVAAYRSAGLPRREMVRRLQHDLRGAITLGAAPGKPFNEDEAKGIAEFRMTQRRLEVARARGFTAPVVLGGQSFSQGALYRAYLTVRPER